VKHGIDILRHGAVERGGVLDRPFHQADGIFLQLRQPGVGPMQRGHIPARLRELLDEVEADKARATGHESGLVRHGLRPLVSRR